MFGEILIKCKLHVDGQHTVTGGDAEPAEIGSKQSCLGTDEW